MKLCKTDKIFFPFYAEKKKKKSGVHAAAVEEFASVSEWMVFSIRDYLNTRSTLS